MLFIFPYFEREQPGCGFGIIGDVTGVDPAFALVEVCGAGVADGTREPSPLEAARSDPHLAILEQRCCNACASRLRRNKDLVELVCLDCAETFGIANWSDDIRCVEHGTKTLREAFERPLCGEVFGNVRRVGFVPSVVPDMCEPREILGHGLANCVRHEQRQLAGGPKKTAAEDGFHLRDGKFRGNMAERAIEHAACAVVGFPDYGHYHAFDPGCMIA